MCPLLPRVKLPLTPLLIRSKGMAYEFSCKQPEAEAAAVIIHILAKESQEAAAEPQEGLLECD